MAERKPRSKGINLVSPPSEIEVNIPESVETHVLTPEEVPSAYPGPPEEAWDEEGLNHAHQEFNDFVKMLVSNLVDEKISGLDERIRDLETVVGRAYGVEAPHTVHTHQTVEAPSYHSEIPEYRSPSQGDGGVPWYEQ